MLFPALLMIAAPADAAAASANAADLQCMALISAALTSAPEGQKMGLAAGMTFYYGRISGRSPEFDVQAEMIAMLKKDPQGAELIKQQSRCAQEMQAMGSRLTTLGNAVTASGKPAH